MSIRMHIDHENRFVALLACGMELDISDMWMNLECSNEPMNPETEATF